MCRMTEMCRKWACCLLGVPCGEFPIQAEKCSDGKGKGGEGEWEVDGGGRGVGGSLRLFAVVGVVCGGFPDRGGDCVWLVLWGVVPFVGAWFVGAGVVFAGWLGVAERRSGD